MLPSRESTIPHPLRCTTPIQTIHSATLLRSECIDLIGNIISGVLPRNDLKAHSGWGEQRRQKQCD
jgi:hypothetical protein